MQTCHETARDIPFAEDADVTVCGGGPAGSAAAIAAARSGAVTHLIEAFGCLGGIWTSGLMSWILDADNKPGLMREIINELDQRGARLQDKSHRCAFDVEEMKLLLEEMCLAAGVKVRFYTRVVAAKVDGSNRLDSAITESKSGREAWRAKVFVDATGDGDLAAFAGCGFEMGRPSNSQTQPMSLICLLAGLNFDEIRQFVCSSDSQQHQKLYEEIRRASISPSYRSPGLFHISEDFFELMANHEYGRSGIDAAQLTGATLQARKEVHQIVKALRAMGGPWRNVRLVATSAKIGVREGRRVKGRYVVSASDAVSGRRHEDGICRVTFPVDIHSTDPSQGQGYSQEGLRAQPFDIPLRSLIARDIEGLLLAGRCISGDFYAHASYRVSGNAVALGQAAGATAAIAARENCLPHKVPLTKVKQALNEINA